MSSPSPQLPTKTTQSAPVAHTPVPKPQPTPAPEIDSATTVVQRAVNAAGSSSPQTPPTRYGSLLGQLQGRPNQQRGVLKQLQRSYGNQYVGQVIQAKLTVGQPGDKYEEEADRVADLVMRMPELGTASETGVSAIQPLQIQRMCEECEEEEKESIQPMHIQRMCEECAEEEEEERVYPKELPGQTPAVTPSLETRLSMTSGTGQPLSESARMFMEPRFGRDFSDVRVHTGGEAAQLSQELKAQAFTHGQDVYFGTGKYNPQLSEGKRLLAHELTHVVQQSRNSSGNRQKISQLSRVGLVQKRDGETHEAEKSLRRVSETKKGEIDYQGIINRFTSWGDLDEKGLGKFLSRHAKTSSQNYAFVLQLIKKLSYFDRDDVVLYFGIASSNEDLDKFASTELGRRMLLSMESELLKGITLHDEEVQVGRFRQAIARYETAQTGLKRGRKILEAAATMPVTSPTETGKVIKARPLGHGELTNRLRLIGTILERVGIQYQNDIEVLSAVRRARSTLQATRTDLNIDTAAAMSQRISESQQITEAIENLLPKFNLLISTHLQNEESRTSSKPYIELIQTVQKFYIKALGDILTTNAADTFNRAEKVAEQLPRALIEARLTSLEGRETFDVYEFQASLRLMKDWAGRLHNEVDAFYKEAQEIARQKARSDKAADLEKREKQFQAKGERLALSIEALNHWERALNALEYLYSGVGTASLSLPFTYLHYRLPLTYMRHCEAMRDAAYANDLKKLRQIVTVHRNDPYVKFIYSKLGNIVRAARTASSLNTVLWAAFSAASVGGVARLALSSPVAAGEITTGTVLAGAGTAAIEALTFTTVHRGLSELFEPGGAHGSFLGDLVWNFGLFVALRGISRGVRTAIKAERYAALVPKINLAANVGFLQGYGVLRFRIEEERWPTAKELAMITSQNLIMLVGISLGTRAVNQWVEGHLRLRALRAFRQRYSERFAEIERGFQKNTSDLRNALERGRNIESSLNDLKIRAERLQKRLQGLIEEVMNDRTISLKDIRTELKSLGEKPMASLELLARSLGMPAEVGLRRAGGSEQYTYEQGKTDLLKAKLRDLGVTSLKEWLDVPSGLRTLVAAFRDRPVMIFAERGQLGLNFPVNEISVAGRTFRLPPNMFLLSTRFYPPSTAQSRGAAQRVIHVLNAAFGGPPVPDPVSNQPSMRAVGVYYHQNGTVTVAVSGGSLIVRNIYNMIRNRLPAGFILAPEAVPNLQLKPIPLPTGGTEQPRVCAEVRLGVGARLNPSPVEGMTVVRWGTRGGEGWIIDPITGEMTPCYRCQGNAARILSGVSEVGE